VARRLAADTAYGSAEMLDWLVHDQGIEPRILVIDKSERIDGTFSRADFAYDHAQDLYRGSKPQRPLLATISAAAFSTKSARC